jgi:hypothetical protein
VNPNINTVIQINLQLLSPPRKAPKKKAAGDGEKPAVKKVEKKAAPEPKKEPEVKQTHWSCPRCKSDVFIDRMIIRMSRTMLILIIPEKYSTYASIHFYPTPQ